MAAVSSPSDQVAGALENLSISSETLSAETPEFPKKDIYGNNGSLGNQQGYGYGPYSTYASPDLGNDGQLYGTQQYQYPAPFYQATASTGGTQAEVPTAAANKATLSVGNAAGNPTNMLNVGIANKVNGPKPFRPVNKSSSSSFNSSYNKGARFSPSYHDSMYGYDSYQSTIPWLDAINAGYNSQSNSHPRRPMLGLGQAAGAMNMMYPYNRAYSQYGYRSCAGFGSFNNTSWANNGWVVVDSTYRMKGRGFGNENAEGLGELNRGPRGKVFKNHTEFAEPIQEQKLGLKENNKEEKTMQMPDKEHYNRDDFPEDYSNAKFFVIKSYSEDDVHKSIKYGVWASTPNGNRKLDAAYSNAKENSVGCPVFLLFSVNTSGQFVGLAEMMGPVDFNKTVDYWQQEKWIGCFPVKWHIIKDVPNSCLRHITLENNENKPVTNSRDTQEVILEKGMQIIKIFKGHKGKTSILDDFGFYAARESVMREKRAKQKIQKQVSDGKSGDDLTESGKKSVDSELKQPGAVADGKMNGEVKNVKENGSEVAVENSVTPKKGVNVVASAS